MYWAYIPRDELVMAENARFNPYSPSSISPYGQTCRQTIRMNVPMDVMR
jgi:hypothetical protein